MKALNIHFEKNNNCVAEQESETIVTVFSDKYNKIWKLNPEHYYIYRIYCNPLKGQPNPFNIFIGKAKDLVGYKVDKMHSQTHRGCLYDIVEITKIPSIPKKYPIEIIKILQNYIPNISYNYNSESIMKRMRDVIRNMVDSNKNTIFHWLKTIQYKFNVNSLSQFKVNQAEINEEPLRQILCDELYDIVNQSENEKVTNKIIGVIYKSYSIPLNDIKEFVENNEKLNLVIDEIKKSLILNSYILN